MTDPRLTIALISIARPTFDVPLAQSVADTVCARLQDAGLEVVGPGAQLLMDGPAATGAIAQLAEQSFDLLILLQASFADSSVAVEIVQTLAPRRIPVLLWAVPDPRDGGRLRLNSLCGINLAGHALSRRQLHYDYLHEPADSALAIDRVRSLARAGWAIRALQTAQIGLVGSRPVGFDTCDYDEGDLRTLFGVHVKQLPLTELLKDAAAAPQEARQRFVRRAAAYAGNLAELDATAVNGTAGVYTALRDTADRHGLNALAVRCWPEFFTELGCAACGAMSMLNEERCPASCEADVNGALTSLLLQSISGEVAFVTDLVSIDPSDDTGVLWHCGLAPVSMADPAVAIRGTVHSNRKLPLLFEFPLKPGRITLARLHRTGSGQGRDGYRLVIGGGEMVQAPPSFSGTSGVIRFDAPAAVVLDRVMRHGLEHHVNITYGDHQTELAAVARVLGLAVIELTT